MCNCIDELNRRLGNENSMVDFTIWTCVNPEMKEYGRKKKTAVIVSKKLKPSKTRRMLIVPTYCPFCGKKYKYDFTEETGR